MVDVLGVNYLVEYTNDEGFDRFTIIQTEAHKVNMDIVDIIFSKLEELGYIKEYYE